MAQYEHARHRRQRRARTPHRSPLRRLAVDARTHVCTPFGHNAAASVSICHNLSWLRDSPTLAANSEKSLMKSLVVLFLFMAITTAKAKIIVVNSTNNISPGGNETKIL